VRKLKALATALAATILRPYYPAADLFRVVSHDGLQIDFLATIHGVRSFAGLRDRSSTVTLGGASLRVASLPDIIKSKKAAVVRRMSRSWVSWRGPMKRPVARKKRLAALRRESDRALVELIRRQLALPPEKRTNFLRKRVGPRGSAL